MKSVKNYCVITLGVIMVFVISSCGGGTTPETSGGKIEFNLNYSPTPGDILNIGFNTSGLNSEVGKKEDAIKSLEISDIIFTPDTFVTATGISFPYDDSAVVNITIKATGTTKVTIKSKGGYTFVPDDDYDDFEVTKE